MNNFDDFFNLDNLDAPCEALTDAELAELYKTETENNNSWTIAIASLPNKFEMKDILIGAGVAKTDLAHRVNQFRVQILDNMLNTCNSKAAFDNMLNELLNVVLNPAPLFFQKEGQYSKLNKVPANIVQVIANTYRNLLMGIDC